MKNYFFHLNESHVLKKKKKKVHSSQIIFNDYYKILTEYYSIIVVGCANGRGKKITCFDLLRSKIYGEIK